MDADEVLRRRLATQHLTGPAAATPTQVVSDLLCVQAQEDREARAMVAYRCEAGAVSAVDAALAAGEIIRTHVLRPTWHFVAADDLRWLLALTSPKVEAGMASRHRQLSLDADLLDSGIGAIADRLAGRSFADRRALGTALVEAGLLDASDPLFGQRVGHLLLVAELRAVICSAPQASAQHTYALVSEVVPETPARSRDEALTELVTRFITSHGPVTLKDLQRWTPLTLVDIRTGLANAAGLTSTTVDGVELWHGTAVPDEVRPRRGWLLSCFDEAYLSYRPPSFRRTAGHPSGDAADWFIANRGGPVLLDGRDVGTWQRKAAKPEPQVTLKLDPGLTAGERAAVDEAADLLRATFAR